MLLRQWTSLNCFNDLWPFWQWLVWKQLLWRSDCATATTMARKWPIVICLVIVHWSESFKHPLPDVWNDSGYALILCHLYWAKFWESPHWCHLWAKSWNLSKIHWSIFRPFFCWRNVGLYIKVFGGHKRACYWHISSPSLPAKMETNETRVMSKLQSFLLLDLVLVFPNGDAARTFIAIVAWDCIELGLAFLGFPRLESVILGSKGLLLSSME